MKQSTLELIVSSTSHGLPKIFSTKRTSLKLIWSFLLTISIGYCVYFIVDNILSYLDYEYNTSINIIHQKQLEFPTFCSDPTDFGNKSIKEIVKYYRFNADTTFNPKKDFEKFNDGSYGVCYRFNSGKNMLNEDIYIKNTTLSGYLFGLNLKIYLKSNNSLIIFIHNHTSVPITISNRETFLSPGYKYSFKIEQVFTKKLDLPYNDCYKDIKQSPFNKTFINYIKMNNKAYTNNQCIELCYTGFYLEYSQCNCMISYFYEVTNKCYFGANEVLRNCSINFLHAANNQINQVYEVCKKYCPLECDSMEYKIYTNVALTNESDSVELINNGEFKIKSLTKTKQD